METRFSLTRAQDRTNSLVAKLSSALSILASAGQMAEQAQSQTARSMSDSYTQDDRYQSQRSQAHLQQTRQAQQAHAQAMSEVENIVSQLTQCQAAILQFLAQQQSNLNLLHQQGAKLNRNVSTRFRDGEDAAQHDIKECRRILEKIASALRKAQQGVSGISDTTAGQMSGLSSIVSTATSRGSNDRSSQSSYQTVSPLVDTICRLDSDRYHVPSVDEYAAPYLGKPGNYRDASLYDKVTLGDAFAEDGKPGDYQVNLPKDYHKVLDGIYKASSNGGRYSTNNYVS